LFLQLVRVQDPPGGVPDPTTGRRELQNSDEEHLLQREAAISAAGRSSKQRAADMIPRERYIERAGKDWLRKEKKRKKNRFTNSLKTDLHSFCKKKLLISVWEFTSCLLLLHLVREENLLTD
jgi:hypothetical protein